MSTMILPFHTRGRDGRLKIDLYANDDPYATGHDQVAKNFDAAAFTGFPVLTAEVTFPRVGPAGWFGWVQLNRQPPIPGDGSGSGSDWTLLAGRPRRCRRDRDPSQRAADQ